MGITGKKNFGKISCPGEPHNFTLIPEMGGKPQLKAIFPLFEPLGMLAANLEYFKPLSKHTNPTRAGDSPRCNDKSWGVGGVAVTWGQFVGDG